tara:strand:+ start:78128 stop:79657 length:1530 start_codon:yes stop_codon:yes gene_type:complete
MRKEIDNIKGDIISIYEEGGFDSYGIKTQAAKYIMEKTGLKKTAAKDWAKRIYDECLALGSVEIIQEVEEVETEEVFETDLEFTKDYIYNKEDDNYVFLLQKQVGRNVILDGTTIRSFIKNYSNYSGDTLTLNKIALRYGISKEVVQNIFRILKITHDSLPITPEELEEKSVEEIRDETLDNKRFVLHQEIQKQDWKQTEADAKKWNRMIVGKYNPFVEAIEDWTPPSIANFSPNEITAGRDDSKTFMCVLTDTHIGELTKESWEGKTFNTPKAIANILSYLTQMHDKLQERTVVPSDCKLVIMGDILNSFVDGMTRRGTKLHNDVINGDLYKIGLDVIITFVRTLREMFPTVSISCVKGNHDSDLVYAVYYAASRYFENTTGIDWKISTLFIDSFKINNCYFIYSHGKDDEYHVSIPKTTSKNFESFVQSLLLAKIEDIIGVKSKYFLSGHLHSYQHNELNDFEQIQVPASVNADGYAEALGYRSKARQNCFIVGQDYIEETLHFFFD